MADGVTTKEGTHVVGDGTKLYTKTWKPSAEPLAILVFIHGFSDHCNAYYSLFPALAARRILVHSFDQRGWGRSITNPASRGLSGPTALVLSDITSFLTTLVPTSIPLFLMGHSMGGGEILTYAAHGPPHITAQITGYLAESPLIGLAPTSAATKLTILLGKLAAKVAPHFQLEQKLDPSTMSRDPQVCKDFNDDVLCHNMGTLEGLNDMLTRGRDLVSGKTSFSNVADSKDGRLPFRVWVGHGTGDLVTDPVASKKWIEGLPKGVDATFREYPGWYHKLHAEPGEDRATFANEVADWILARPVTEGTEASKSML